MDINPLSVYFFSGLLLIIIVWLLTSPHSLDKFFLTLLRSKLIYILPIIFLIFMMQILEPSLLQWPPSFLDTICMWFGAIIYLAGLLLTIWGKSVIKSSWGMPEPENPSKQRRLIIKGPFVYTRNPMYVGFLTMLFGFELSLRSWLVLLIVPAFYLINLSIQREERMMSIIFGDEFREYKKKVRKYL